MRNGLTLIELIFSMVIVAFVFTIVPKIIFGTTKSIELTIKEDALFNAVSLSGLIAYLPWDEANTANGVILATDSLYFPCSSVSGYRVGGFAGGRNCLGTTLNASSGLEGSVYNDVDDYDGYSVNTLDNRHTIAAQVLYVDDAIAPTAADATVNLSDTPAAGSSNLKKVTVTVTNTAAHTKAPLRSSFFFYSANIGHAQINKRYWQ